MGCSMDAISIDIVDNAWVNPPDGKGSLHAGKAKGRRVSDPPEAWPIRRP